MSNNNILEENTVQSESELNNKNNPDSLYCFVDKAGKQYFSFEKPISNDLTLVVKNCFVKGELTKEVVLGDETAIVYSDYKRELDGEQKFNLLEGINIFPIHCESLEWLFIDESNAQEILEEKAKEKLDYYIKELLEKIYDMQNLTKELQLENINLKQMISDLEATSKHQTNRLQIKKL